MQAQNISYSNDIFDFPGSYRLFDSILSRRVLAFTLDAIVIGFLIAFASMTLFIIGIATFGLLWFAIPPVAVALIFAYVAFTAGGPQSATPGMFALGLEMRMRDGRKPYPSMAAFHALLFYICVTVLTPFVLLVGLFGRRGRLLHDYIAGILVMNRDGLPPHLRSQ